MDRCCNPCKCCECAKYYYEKQLCNPYDNYWSFESVARRVRQNGLRIKRINFEAEHSKQLLASIHNKLIKNLIYVDKRIIRNRSKERKLYNFN